MRPPFRSAPLWLALGLASAAALASADDAQRAADPHTPSAMPPPWAIEAQRLDTPDEPADLAQALSAWREANARVAEFPRGHADLLRWEQARATAAPASAVATAPLGFGDVLRSSLRQRPELFTRAGMNELESARVRSAYAAHQRALRRAWHEALAQRERARLLMAVLDAARAGSELGRRMQSAGNWPAARLMQEQLVEARAWQAANEAALASHGAREALARLMGLWRSEDLQALAERLPALPALPEGAALAPPPEGIEAAALAADPLLAIERLAAQQQERGLDAARWGDWQAAQNAALAALAEPPNAQPPHLADLRLLRDARLLQAEAQRAALQTAAAARRSQARELWQQRQARLAGAQHADGVQRALREALLQESQRRYNGMFDSSWQLLAAAREHSSAIEAALLARRDFWQAQADWDALIAGAEPRPDQPGAAAAAPESDQAGH